MNGSRQSSLLSPVPVIHRRSPPVVKFNDPLDHHGGRSRSRLTHNGVGDDKDDPNKVNDEGDDDSGSDTNVEVTRRPSITPRPKVPFNPCGCFDYCCCVDNLRRGCVAIGMYQSIMGTVGTVCLCVLLATADEKSDPDHPTMFESFCSHLNMVPGGAGVTLILQYMVTLAAGIVIVIGASRRKTRLCLTHSILMIVSFVLGIMANIWKSTMTVSLFEQIHTWSSVIYSCLTIVYFGIASYYLRKLLKYKDQYPTTISII